VKWQSSCVYVLVRVRVGEKGGCEVSRWSLVRDPLLYVGRGEAAMGEKIAECVEKHSYKLMVGDLTKLDVDFKAVGTHHRRLPSESRNPCPFSSSEVVLCVVCLSVFIR